MGIWVYKRRNFLISLYSQPLSAEGRLCIMRLEINSVTSHVTLLLSISLLEGKLENELFR
jgi:hypothetical protein